MTTYNLILDPAGPGQFKATLDDTILVNSTTQPLLDGARALAARGADPDSIITTRHRLAADWSLRSRIGVAARLTVVERRSGSAPRFIPWVPFPAARMPARARIVELEMMLRQSSGAAKKAKAE